MAIVPTDGGAVLRCVFQKLEGEATREGLWLTSTVSDAVKDRFRVVAVSVGRQGERRAAVPAAAAPNARTALDRLEMLAPDPAAAAEDSRAPLSPTGTVAVDEKLVRFIRPGLIEEYSVSMDGVRQDFVVQERPADRSAGSPPASSAPAPPADEPSALPILRLELAVSGARVEATDFGARLVLDNSGRKIAYSRLQVTDATGRDLPAQLEVASGVPPDVEGRHLAARNLAPNSPTPELKHAPESTGLEVTAPRLREQAVMPPLQASPCWWTTRMRSIPSASPDV